ncbi:AAA family ATPase [Bacillus sp. B6(2022)]|nr:AAA family ATPase [Bacillus sp. B6(2022)]
MDIIIEEMRIRNYKCYESVDVKFKKSSLILGANNSGKTSLLEALKLCFTRYSKVDEELIFVRKNEELTKDKK